MQASLSAERKYQRRVHESVRPRKIRERQQRPGPELSTRRILMAPRRGGGGRSHLRVVRRRIDCNLVLGGKVTIQAPDFLVSVVVVVKDKVPVVVLAGGIGLDVRLQAII